MIFSAFSLSSCMMGCMMVMMGELYDVFMIILIIDDLIDDA